jgi:hypothetical protein
MNIDTEFTHVTPIGGNVFVDLGFEPEEATALQAESQGIIREKLVFKNSLISERSTDEKPI